MSDKKCYGCNDALSNPNFHVLFNDAEEVNACPTCVAGWFEEIPEEIISVKVNLEDE